MGGTTMLDESQVRRPIVDSAENQIVAPVSSQPAITMGNLFEGSMMGLDVACKATSIAGDPRAIVASYFILPKPGIECFNKSFTKEGLTGWVPGI